MRIRPKFHCRIPSDALATDDPCGYTMWHLLAMGVLEQAEVDDFLRRASKGNTNTLIDDLREHMALLPERERTRVTSGLTDHEAEIWWYELRKQTAFLSPMGICVQLDRPLLAGYRWDESSLHPVVKAFHWESCLKLGLDPDGRVP